MVAFSESCEGSSRDNAVAGQAGTTSGTPAALLDTSVLIASDSGRPVQADLLPEESLVSVVTIAELRLGVLAASTTQVRARRLATLDAMSALEAVPIDVAAAGEWARLRMVLAEAGRRMNVNDLWIAAVAAASELPIVTQDDDFDVLAELGAAQVIKV